jgi:hypothetical protein
MKIETIKPIINEMKINFILLGKIEYGYKALSKIGLCSNLKFLIKIKKFS